MQTANEMRKVFDDAIADTTDAELIAKRELLREYFCNPEFRAAMHDEVARLNGLAA